MRSLKYLLPVILIALLAIIYTKHTGHHTQSISQVLVNPNAAESGASRLIDVHLASKAELQQEVCAPPADNHEREKALAQLFIQAGAPQSEIKYQPLDPTSSTSANNVYLIKPGRTDKILVVGGHLDKVAIGNGVIDDWSGVCAVSNIYQAVREISTEHTIIFIGFANEELGLFGSKAFVENIKAADKPRYQGMLNLECLGAESSHIWLNFVDPAMKEILTITAQREKLPLFGHEIPNVSADSKTFYDAGIPSITVDSLTDFSFIHTVNDKCDKLNIDNYYQSYQLMVAYLLALDQSLGKSKSEKLVTK